MTFPRYEKTTQEAGVNGDINFKSAGIVIKDSEVPKFDGKLAYRELVRVAELVSYAKESRSFDDGKVKEALAPLVKFKGIPFRTEMMKKMGIENMNDAAKFVQMDDPIDLFIFADRYLRDTLKLEPKFTFQPEEGINFITGAGNVFDSIAPLTIQRALTNAFAVKWKRNIARPEEVISLCLKDEDSNAPEMLKEACRAFVDKDSILKDSRKFTLYSTGCPPHTTYVAGHGTFAGSIFALLVIKYGLSEGSAAFKLLAQTMLSFAHCRSIAGVHYFQDNLEGFKLGVKVAQRTIADTAEIAGVSETHAKELAEFAETIDMEWAA